MEIDKTPTAAPCWMDLAATDVSRAIPFYAGLFGWTAQEQRLNEGVFVVLSDGRGRVASLYQIDPAQVAAGAPSHWLPYVLVRDLDGTVAKVEGLGGSVMVPPFHAGLARVAVVIDTVGAQVGLWEPVPEPASD